ncbi:MAG: hypothetical protein H6747_10495 [Deltaproteobacteria bacterium]|nr:hypothetical protein [Deltaproteobacteria bacterium]
MATYESSLAPRSLRWLALAVVVLGACSSEPDTNATGPDGQGGGSDSGGNVQDTAKSDTGVSDTVGTGDATDTADTATQGDTTDVDTGKDTVDPTDTGGVAEKCNGIDDDGDGKTDEDACDDGLPCTEDFCDKVQKFCTFTPIAAGGTCDDGNACTSADACKAGICVGTPSTDCNDGDACTDDSCNPADGSCGHTARAAGASCDDGSQCTVVDICKDGACVGTALKCDDGDPCTTDACDLAIGCTSTAADGVACDDGDLCSKDDVCAGGTCAGKVPADCVAENDCQLAACNPADGTCKKANKPDGTACDDGDLCTNGETCGSGSCSGGTAQSCSSNGACQTAACDPTSGTCKTTLKPDGEACDDGDACTLGETCQSGSCVKLGPKCDDGNPCTADACDAGTGCKNTPTAGACDDGDACTVGEGCVDGKCAGAQPKSCDDGTECTEDACDALTGDCKHDGSKMDGKPCDDDASACTVGESCTQNKCLGGIAKTCKDDDPCTSDGCDPKSGGCVFPAAAPGTPCNDGSFCSFGDACDATGKCTGNVIDCNDKNPCTTDSCDPKTGACSFVKKQTGDACEDGDKCTNGDACDAAGLCKAGTPTDCNDGNLCTDDACDGSTGKCQNLPNNKPCDDGSICTTGESCIEGACKSGIDGDVSTIAGSGTAAFLDGAAASARFNYPRDVEPLADGSALVADYTNHRIRIVGANGQVSTLAGQSSYGLVDGQGTAARFYYPAALAVHAATGDIFVADRGNHAIRRVTATGAVTTFAGTNSASFKDDKGTAARFYYPEGIAVDSNGVVFVADRYNHAIRRIETDGTVTTVAGTNSSGYLDAKGNAARFTYPAGIAVDDKGVLFVAEAGGHRIRAVLSDGTVSTVAGAKVTAAGFQDGFGFDARFNSPEDIIFSPAGYLIVVDRGNQRLRKVTKQGKVSTFSGSGTAGFVDGASEAARYNNPFGVGVDATGRVWVADGANNRIRRTALGVTICTDGKICTADICDAKTGCKFTAIDSGKPCEDNDSCLTGGTCDGSGACKGQQPKCQDAATCKLAQCDPVSGTCIPDYEGKKCDDGDPCTTGEACAAGSCVASGFAFTTLTGNGTNGVVDGAGQQSQHAYPRGVAIGSFGAIWVADYNGQRIRRITGQSVVTIAGNASAGFQDGADARFSGPSDVAVEPSGSVVVADRNNHRIRRVDASGNTTTVAGNGTATWKDGTGTDTSFYYPEGIDVGPDGTIYVADTYNNRIRRISTAGVVDTLAGSGSSSYLEGVGTSSYFYRPGGVAVAGGTLYVADSYNHRIRRIDIASKKTSLVAGNGTAKYADGVGAGASFYYPADVDVDADGNLFVADRANYRIRHITPGGTVSSLAGSVGGFEDGPGSSAKFNNPYGIAVAANVIYVADSNNYRVRRGLGPLKDCDDSNPCTTDSCDAKTGACKHVTDPQCCNPNPVYLDFEDAADVDGFSFFTCDAEKLSIEGSACSKSSGKPPVQGWQHAPGLKTAWSAPGALYYGEFASESYDFGASAGKMVTKAFDVPTGGKTLSFRVYFDTEPQSVFDRLYVWLQVDGKRVLVGKTDPPDAGSVWYKGSPGYDQAKTWSKIDIDIQAHVGKKVALEFSFNTGDGQKNSGLGVVIDDLVLSRTCGK